MKKNENMQEQYEDALFSLLMERVAESRGAEAYEENEKLKADPAFEVPEDLEKRCINLIRKKVAKQSSSETKRVIKMTLYRAAAVACVALVLFATVFAASPKLQTSAINFLIREFDGYTTFSFTDRVSVSDAPKVNVTWLPNGFFLTAREQNPMQTVLIYQNEDGALIRIHVSDVHSSISIDNEKTDSSTVTINDHAANYSDDGMIKTIVWLIESSNYSVMITSTGVPEAELFQIAKELCVAN